MTLACSACCSSSSSRRLASSAFRLARSSAANFLLSEIARLNSKTATNRELMKRDSFGQTATRQTVILIVAFRVVEFERIHTVGFAQLWNSRFGRLGEKVVGRQRIGGVRNAERR